MMRRDIAFIVLALSWRIIGTAHFTDGSAKDYEYEQTAFGISCPYTQTGAKAVVDRITWLEQKYAITRATRLTYRIESCDEES